jgi:hypothetical protein
MPPMTARPTLSQEGFMKVTTLLRFGLVRVILALAILSANALSPAAAQEIIVEKRSVRAGPGGVQPEARPAIVFRKRADSVVQGLLVTDDTRNAESRLEELKTALEGLAAAATRSHGVHVALFVETAEGLKLVRPFDRSRAIAAIENGSRPDTAQVRLLVKTEIVDADTDLSQPVGRIDAFLKTVKLAGRCQFEPLEEPALSLVQPEQYRGAVVAAIAADLHAVAERFGQGYGGKLEGLEQPLEWVQLDELELGLYIPYRLTVTR